MAKPWDSVESGGKPVSAAGRETDPTNGSAVAPRGDEPRGEGEAQARDLPTPLRLRDDLLVTAGYGPEGGIIVKDPVGDRYYRFVGVAGRIIPALDGEIDLAGVKELLQADAPGPLPPETAALFLKGLDEKMLLDRGLTSAELKAEAKVRLKRKINIFYWRLKLFNPDRLLRWLSPYLKPLFRPWFVILCFALILGGLVATPFLPSKKALLLGQVALYKSNLPLHYLIFLILVAIHEFGHALTCAHFGGRVKEMGFILIFGNPCYYCNVSDTYLFPSRSQRLWVSFAGAFVELAVWGAALILLAVLRPEGRLFQILAAVANIAGLRNMLLNLNPLLRFDGYYLLADWLEMPNLRQRAFAVLGELLANTGRRLLGREPGRVSRPHRRGLLLAYALVSTGYLLFMLVAVVYLVPGWLQPMLDQRLPAPAGFLLAWTAALVLDGAILWGLGKQLFASKEAGV